MFRLKLKIDPDVLQAYYTRVKTGVRGMGFVRTKTDVAWPADLQPNIPAPPKGTEGAAPAAPTPQAAAPASPTDSQTPAK